MMSFICVNVVPIMNIKNEIHNLDSWFTLHVRIYKIVLT